MSDTVDFDIFMKLRQRLTRQIPVGGIDFSAFRTLDAKRVEILPRSILMNDGGDAPHLYVVEQGWLIAHTSLASGSRYIHRIFQPGDIIGEENINWTFSTSTVTAVTRSSLGQFPKQNYLKLFSNTTRLGAALHAISMAEQVVMVDTARANARLDARDRLGHLLLAIEARQKLMTGGGEDAPFDLPLTQAILADTAGLSLVHTSNELRKLEESGFIERSRDRCRILRRHELISRTGFRNRYVSSRPEWIEQLSMAVPAD